MSLDGSVQVEHLKGGTAVMLDCAPDGEIIPAGTVHTAHKLMDEKGFPATRRA